MSIAPFVGRAVAVYGGRSIAQLAANAAAYAAGQYIRNNIGAGADYIASKIKDRFMKRKSAATSSFGQAQKATRSYIPKKAGEGYYRIVKGYTRTGGAYGRYAPMGNELKYFDTSIAFAVDATGEVPATGQLNLIPQGVTESTRIGRMCIIRSIYLKGLMQYSPGASASTAAPTTCWIYVVLDTQCNGAAASVTDVLTSNNMAVAVHNLNNSQRFRVLRVFKATFNPPAGVTGAYIDTQKRFEFFKKCNIPIDFSSTTGALTEIRSNNIFLLAGSNNSDDQIQVVATCRLRFADR